jgi:hypothetical protein
MKEITEYARYACEGKKNERSHLLDHCGYVAHEFQRRLQWHEKLSLRSRRPMRTLQPKRSTSTSVWKHNASAMRSADVPIRFARWVRL